MRRALLSSAVGSLLRAVLALALRRGATVAGALVASLHLARLAVRASAAAVVGGADSATSSTTPATTTSDVHQLGPLLMRLAKVEHSKDVRLALDALIDELPATIGAIVRRRDAAADDGQRLALCLSVVH